MRRKIGLLLGAALLLIIALPAATVWTRLERLVSRLTPTSTLVASPGVDTGSDTAEALAKAVVPQRDAHLLAERLHPDGADIPEVVNPQPPQYAVGDRARFWVSDSDTRETFQVTATLRVISRYAEMWVQDGVPVDQKGLEGAAAAFDDNIYPTVHRYFGTEWNPGVDNDPRVVILNARFSGAAGYFSSQDEVSHEVNPYSNEREMLYISVDSAAPGTPHYGAIAAHEFQHMVHWHQDANEDSWVNEGASELAARLCGYGATPAVGEFALKPETQLNAWALSPDEDTLPHYGASYLWLDYFLQREGIDALKAAIAEPADGIEGFEKVLERMGGGATFDALYADWVVANYVDDQSLEEGRYAHDAADPRMAMKTTHRDVPVQENGTVSQYGTDYIALTPRSKAITIEFTGSPTVPVVPNTPFQGHYEWWSNRGDVSDTTLTRAFDLTGLRKATLQYALWYELEDGWDYAYVEVSTDNGEHWTPLATQHSTDYNPNGNAFGPGYTGFSGHPPASKTMLEPSWIQEEVDLSPYAGRRILVRFEVVTDDAVNLPGFCLDNIAVPELQFRDDAESDSAGWQAEGFLRMNNQLPQRFLVEVIEQGKQTHIQRLQLDEQQHGKLTLSSLGEGVDRVVLAISGLTRYTTEPARYSYSVSPAD